MMVDVGERFGTVVRQLREAHGWSQERLAGRAELNRSYMGEVERHFDALACHSGQAGVGAGGAAVRADLALRGVGRRVIPSTLSVTRSVDLCWWL